MYASPRKGWCEWEGPEAQTTESLRLTVAQSIVVTRAGRRNVRIPESTDMWALRCTVSEQEKERSGKKGEEREGRLAQEYPRHDCKEGGYCLHNSAFACGRKVWCRFRVFPVLMISGRHGEYCTPVPNHLILCSTLSAALCCPLASSLVCCCGQ